ncbi:myb/SANT-like DNA-binding domain-containing protein 4 isoform X1 [Spodoptera frugiperda]|uniref:Regulatory protein zeste n=2 Tax=Spodoptera frugiperda TaxID=7108 RepID=A0A9R0E5H8_SPOFR|nr:myb/SANT-like DNA-binding domain-containing protein 4 isoform X1 [Spodoptera frugiperda]
MESRLRASPEQFSLLIEFMESHGDLSRPQMGLQGKVRSEGLWQELAEILNAVGGGINKTADKWKRVWSDWKTKTKKKASVINRDIHGTGGGPSRGKPLSRLEERVLRIIGVSSITGNQAVQEAGFQEEPQPQVRHAADTTDTVPSLVDETEFTIIEIAPESTSTSVPVPDITVPPNRPDSPVPGPSNCRTVQRERSPISPGASTPRRHRVRQRRLRQTPFDRATSEFVAIEKNRLRLEQERETRQHNLDMERLKIEAERVKMEADRVRVEEARLAIEADLLASNQTLSSQITSLISLLETRDLRPS